MTAAAPVPADFICWASAAEHLYGLLLLVLPCDAPAVLLLLLLLFCAHLCLQVLVQQRLPDSQLSELLALADQVNAISEEWQAAATTELFWLLGVDTAGLADGSLLAAIVPGAAETEAAAGPSSQQQQQQHRQQLGQPKKTGSSLISTSSGSYLDLLTGDVLPPTPSVNNPFVTAASSAALPPAAASAAAVSYVPAAPAAVTAAAVTAQPGHSLQPGQVTSATPFITQQQQQQQFWAPTQQLAYVQEMQLKQQHQQQPRWPPLAQTDPQLSISSSTGLSTNLGSNAQQDQQQWQQQQQLEHVLSQPSHKLSSSSSGSAPPAPTAAAAAAVAMVAASSDTGSSADSSSATTAPVSYTNPFAGLDTTSIMKGLKIASPRSSGDGSGSSAGGKVARSPLGRQSAEGPAAVATTAQHSGRQQQLQQQQLAVLSKRPPPQPPQQNDNAAHQQTAAQQQQPQKQQQQTALLRGHLGVPGAHLPSCTPQQQHMHQQPGQQLEHLQPQSSTLSSINSTSMDGSSVDASAPAASSHGAAAVGPGGLQQASQLHVLQQKLQQKLEQVLSACSSSGSRCCQVCRLPPAAALHAGLLQLLVQQQQEWEAHLCHLQQQHQAEVADIKATAVKKFKELLQQQQQQQQQRPS
jgi:hypothetical protein